MLKYANFEIIKQYVYKTLVWFSGFFILSYSIIKIFLECLVYFLYSIRVEVLMQTTIFIMVDLVNAIFMREELDFVPEYCYLKLRFCFVMVWYGIYSRRQTDFNNTLNTPFPSFFFPREISKTQNRHMTETLFLETINVPKTNFPKTILPNTLSPSKF